MSLCVAGLMIHYLEDPDSSYRTIRGCTRVQYKKLCGRILADFGSESLSDLNARRIIHWHSSVAGDGKVAMAHALVGMLRVLVNFGVTILEDPDCVRLSAVLHKLRFQQAKPREVALLADQVDAIRTVFRAQGWRSLALAQALQFEGTLRQKDVIGEWDIDGTSEIVRDGKSWIRGIRWEEIDADFILRHVTSKRQKPITIDLKLAPMVMAELGDRPRSDFPESGPVIVRETTGLPWSANEFRTHWRTAARAAGIPDEVRNMDSRAGAITEASEAGIDLEKIKHAATHSNIAMTQRYSRGAEKKTAEVMRGRVAHRQGRANV